MSEPRWLLLAHQLPPRSSNARVKTWRRLQQLGAVAARNSLYALPNTEQCREDFEWIGSEIVALGGEATVFEADAISEGGTEDLVEVFQRMRTTDYGSLQGEIDRLLAAARKKRATTTTNRPQIARAVRALRDRFQAIERVDFFRTAARERTAASLTSLELAIQEPAIRGRTRVSASAGTKLAPADFQARRWVTRRRPGVDRMASAWLIRRFVDPRATFSFVDAPVDPDVPFDMYTGEFSHRGDLCTFEVLAERFGLSSFVVTQVGHIVHDLDMKETKYGPPEAPAVGRMVEGLRALHPDDATLLEHGIGMFEALARSFESSRNAAGRPAMTRTKRGAAGRRGRHREGTS